MEWTIKKITFRGETLSKNEGKTINLLTLGELQELKKVDPSYILVNIFGDEKQAIDCNEDTRQGFVSCGHIK